MSQEDDGNDDKWINSVLCKVILLFTLFLQLVSVPFHNRPHFKTISVCLWLYNCLWERQRKRDKGAGFSSRSLENVQVLYNYIETHGSTLFVTVLDVGNIFDSKYIQKLFLSNYCWRVDSCIYIQMRKKEKKKVGGRKTEENRNPFHPKDINILSHVTF